MPYLLSLFIFAKCVMQGGDITSDITGQFHDLVLRVQYLHGLCVGVVADRKRPGNLGSKFPRSEYFERTTTLTTRIWTLSKDDDDDGGGSENVGKKMNLRSFKLNRVYLDPLNMSNAGDFSWS